MLKGIPRKERKHCRSNTGTKVSSVNTSSHKRREFFSPSIPDYKMVSQLKEKVSGIYKKILTTTTRNVFTSKRNQTLLKTGTPAGSRSSCTALPSSTGSWAATYCFPPRPVLSFLHLPCFPLVSVLIFSSLHRRCLSLSSALLTLTGLSLLRTPKGSAPAPRSGDKENEDPCAPATRPENQSRLLVG